MSTLAASIVTETNASPEFFAQIETQVDLDASCLSGQPLKPVGWSPTVTAASCGGRCRLGVAQQSMHCSGRLRTL
jgi:hypothetical protein